MPINNLSNMVKYTKPALTFKEQVKLLQDRGLQITNIDSVEGILSNISYYRLSAYMLPFKKRNTQGCVVDEFIEGATWENVYNLYKFDRKLRLLVFDAIERLVTPTTCVKSGNTNVQGYNELLEAVAVLRPVTTCVTTSGSEVCSCIYS